LREGAPIGEKQDTLLFNKDGNWVESSSMNLFIVAISWRIHSSCCWTTIFKLAISWFVIVSLLLFTEGVEGRLTGIEGMGEETEVEEQEVEEEEEGNEEGECVAELTDWSITEEEGLLSTSIIPEGKESSVDKRSNGLGDARELVLERLIDEGEDEGEEEEEEDLAAEGGGVEDWEQEQTEEWLLDDWIGICFLFVEEELTRSCLDEEQIEVAGWDKTRELIEDGGWGRNNLWWRGGLVSTTHLPV
jgi:hypothetical protein